MTDATLHTMENEFLTVEVSNHGAEPHRIYDREKNLEILWNADPAHWDRHAPLLFPAVGAHHQGIFRRNGKEYPLEKHGFARNAEFTCTKKERLSVTHELRSSEETLNHWPFDFILEVTHTLDGRELTVSWKVTNPGAETMYFTIGGHPAFRVPVLPNTTKYDYYLGFGHKASVTHRLLNLKTGTTIPESELLPLDNGCCPITEKLFECDTLVFDNGDVQSASILYPDKTPYVEVSCKGFPNFGIWSPPGGPFVCLEPWMGRCDETGFTGDISEKKNINAVNPGDVFEVSYQIHIF